MISGVNIARLVGIVSVLGATAACSTPVDEPSEQIGEHAEASHRSKALRARLIDTSGRSVGAVLFNRVGHRVLVTTTVRGLAPASDFHGFHLHANDNPANGEGCIAPAFTSTDGHYNPTGDTHGDHTGDLPVLYAMEDGTAAASFVTDALDLNDLEGRAVIVHAGRNNYGNIPVGPNPDQYTPNSPAATAATEATGNAGARIACGVIE